MRCGRQQRRQLMTPAETQIELRRELAGRLLESQGQGHPDHTIEKAFRDLLEAANRATASTASVRSKIIPVGVLKALIEVYGTETVTSKVQIANTIVTVEKDKRVTAHREVTIVRSMGGARCARPSAPAPSAAPRWRALRRLGLARRRRGLWTMSPAEHRRQAG
jgi:hypothetical protein